MELAILPTKSTPWFEDGNIVFQAELAQFRVHRGVLSSNSSVFADMFTLPQPSAEGETEATVEGCPVVLLSDNAEELMHVLKALYDRR